MILHNVIQGTKEWHALRNRVKHTASDLAAIRGHSKYKTRAQAIHEAATGIKPEVSEFMQRRFDEGHATEAAARAIVEQMIGEDLYPATATTDDEYLLASSDGATMLGDTGYEHKLWNEDLAAQIRRGEIDAMYTDQMDQQIAVFGFEKIIFVCSDGTRDKFEWLGYTGNPESIARIRADWEQFDKDVAAYVPEVKEAKPILTANPIDHLPALVIEVTGRVTHSNLNEFKAAATAVIGSIKTELVTDQDFVDATAAVKYLKDVEDSAKRAKQNALDQTDSIATLHRALDDVIKMAADVRKALDKKITDEKDRRKAELVTQANQALVTHIMDLNHRLGVAYMPRITAPFADVIKGLKSLDSMQEKINVALANAKVEANAVADLIDYNLKTLTADGADWRFLFPDLASVVTKAKEDFTATLMARVASHKEAEAKRLEKEREKIRAEEQAAAAAQIKEAAPAVMEQIDQAEQSGSLTAQESSGLRDVVAAIAADAVISQAKDCVTTIKLGEICAKLGFTVTADFLGSLGVNPVATEKNAKLYDAAHFPAICRRIADHVMALAFKKAA
jgi:predicted phage-related endonuclease